jgi:hypothetical protein
MRVAGQGYGGCSEGLQVPERHSRHTNAMRRVPN